MDEETIEKQGLAPLEPALKRIDAIKDRTELARALGATLRADVDVLNSTNFHTENLFGLWVAQDLNDPTRYAPFLLQGGLVMPDRDYYLNPSQKMADIRSQVPGAYRRVLTLAQQPDAPARPRGSSRSSTASREVHGSRAGLRGCTQGQQSLAGRGFPTARPRPRLEGVLRCGGSCATRQAVRRVAAERRHRHRRAGGQRAAGGMEGLPALSSASSTSAPSCPRPSSTSASTSTGTCCRAPRSSAPRWKRAVDATSDALGEAVGKLYVERYFPPEEKARAEAMVKNLLAPFAVRIDHLEWMAPANARRGQSQARDTEGRRRLPGPLARLLRASRSCAAMRFGNAERAPSCSNITAT